ncbi:hypothetical protein [Salinarimonas sp.]|uniref:hypothetical protein n=1 Tax=Salinarimonas sp. TaxID=2766526 RepID=UPI0032D984E0
MIGAAFISRPMEDNSPSVNWLEVLSADVETAIAGVRAVTRLRYGGRDRLARLNAGRVRREVAAFGPPGWPVDVVHDPLEPEGDWPADPSHALLTNVPAESDLDKDLVGDLIARCVVSLHPARP